jgi:hypothetical protein
MADILREVIEAGLPIVVSRARRSRSMLAAALSEAREGAA